MSERSAGIITQRIPAGAIPPADQVASAFQLVREAAEMLDLAAATARLETALTDLEKPLVTLASAGVLLGVGLVLREGEEVCGAEVFLEQDGVGEGEEADFSALRLLVGPEAQASLEIICADCALARMLVETALLPALSADTLACSHVRWQGEDEPEVELLAADLLTEEAEDEEGAFDGNDDEREDWR
jgi:hypothetical protein